MRTAEPPDPPAAELLAAIPQTDSALGSDPFAEDIEFDPFLARLDTLSAEATRADTLGRPVAGRPAQAPAVAGDGTPRPSRRRSATETRASRSAELPARLRRRRWATTPPLAEIELPDAQGWLDRLLGANERRRLAALSHLADGELRFDRYGFSPPTIKRVFPLFHALYRFYFRVQSEGHENIPTEGPAILAANHGGLLPFDGAMAVMDVLLNTDPPRLARAIVDRWAGTLPWVNVFYARVGQVIGTRENFSDLLQDGQLMLVFPEGIEAIRKTVTQRYRLQRFRVGFVEQALRAGAPIIPTAIVGSDDQSPILYDVKPIARRLGLPVAPITPTFPWLGPLGLLPYPVSFRIVYGEPLRFHERFGPEGADDTRLVRSISNSVRREVQQLLDRSRSR